MAARSKQPPRRSKTATRTPSGPRRRASGPSRSREAGIGSRFSDPRHPTSDLRVGVISDTHGLMRPEALAALRGVDAILHAGDIGGEHVLDALRAIAPLTFVRGNNDDDDGYGIVRVTIAGRRILLTHIFREELLRERPDVIVFGHSHAPRNEVVDGVLLFNPGSAGPRRFKLPVCVGVIEPDRAYHIELVKRTED